jgi:hypothetical protein
VIAAALSEAFGLTLFGFDCIIPVIPTATPVAPENAPPNRDDTGNTIHHDSDSDSDRSSGGYYPSHIEIIDVNFFPSYKEVEDFPVKLKAYLRRRAGLL